ncbi:TPM domain-containing protein [uncultured Vagococcus sp.]|uniref:TPM domain-containing protein n=1 Tax=uncultured Vagococcus sp. TaxID=189676 RepID=UPI0028D306B7|nr:TPM domain-containing protein [uncultured Vagococcus sp.]
MKKLTRYLQLLVVLFGLSLVIGPTVYGEETIFVEDKAGILTEDDKRYIHDLNESTFKQLEGQPQYAVVTLKKLNGDSIEQYAATKFQELGVGNQDLDNGFLFVISLDDREFRLETGYGVEAVITDSMKEEVITDKVKDFLDQENYRQAVMGVTRNIEQLVKERYGNYGASVAAIENQKIKNQQVLKVVLLGFASLGLVIIFAMIVYLLRKKAIQHRFERFISPKLNVRVYRRPTAGSGLSTITGEKGIKDYQLSKYGATKLIRRSNSRQLSKDDDYLKNILATYLIEDGIIGYWSSHQKVAHYDVDVYLENAHIHQLVKRYGNQLFTADPLQKNPLLTNEGHQLIEPYIVELTAKHKRSLAITKRNKGIVKEAVTAYLQGIRISFKDGVDERLMIALMTYFLLEGRNLAEEDAVDKDLLSQVTMAKMYEKAKKKRRSIESSYRRQAISDLDQMMIGSYYMQQAMVWSSYSSSSSSGGGASFGGGSSGGGGFSGGW